MQIRGLSESSEIEIFWGTNNRDSIMSFVKSLFLIISRTPYSKLFRPSFVIRQVFNLIIVLCVTAFSRFRLRSIFNGQK